MTREIVAEGMLMNRWDRISGTVQHVDYEGSSVLICLPRRRAKVVVRVDDRTGIWLDGQGAGTGAIQLGLQLAAIGKYEGRAFRACSVRLYSRKSSPANAPIDPIQPPAIYFWLLNTGEVAIRQVGRPGEEILLPDHAVFDALRADPDQLRLLFDRAHSGDLPRGDW